MRGLANSAAWRQPARTRRVEVPIQPRIFMFQPLVALPQSIHLALDASSFRVRRGRGRGAGARPARRAAACSTPARLCHIFREKAQSQKWESLATTGVGNGGAGSMPLQLVRPVQRPVLTAQRLQTPGLARPQPGRVLQQGIPRPLSVSAFRQLDAKSAVISLSRPHPPARAARRRPPASPRCDAAQPDRGGRDGPASVGACSSRSTARRGKPAPPVQAVRAVKRDAISADAGRPRPRAFCVVCRRGGARARTREGRPCARTTPAVPWLAQPTALHRARWRRARSLVGPLRRLPGGCRTPASAAGRLRAAADRRFLRPRPRLRAG